MRTFRIMKATWIHSYEVRTTLVFLEYLMYRLVVISNVELVTHDPSNQPFRTGDVTYVAYCLCYNDYELIC